MHIAIIILLTSQEKSRGKQEPYSNFSLKDAAAIVL